MGDRLKNRFRGTTTSTIEDDLDSINKIIQATRKQNFVSPFLDTPEKVQIPNTKFVEDAPRKREADSFTQGILKGLSSPVLGAYQELGQAGDEFKQGKVGSGIADLLKGTLHTAMIPITAPLGAIGEGLKGTGKIGGEVAKGLEQTMQLPFDAVKKGSELVKQVVESTGLDISDSETSKKFNDLAEEVGGLIAMGKGIREAKKYVEAKVPEITVLPKDPELVIKSQETAPVEGLTQEKLPTDLLKELPKQEPVELAPITETPRTPLFEKNKIVINDILEKEGLLTPRQVSRRLTSLVEKGEIKKKISTESIKEIVDEWNANRSKRTTEIKATKNSLDIALPEEMNSTRAVSFDRKSGLTVKEVLEQNPEFKPYIKDLADINDVTAQLNSLYWRKRHKEPLPELPKEKTPETSFEFGENKPTEQVADVVETTSVKNELMNKEREFRGLEPLETKEVRKQDAVYEDAKQKIDSGEIDPSQLAKDIVDNPRILNDSDVAVLGVNARRLKNETTKLVDEISKETDPVKTQELRQKALELEEQYNLNDIASKQTGTDTARALAIRRLELKDDYSVAPLIQRAKIANKGEIVPEEIRVKLETYSKQIVEAEAKLKEYELALSRAQAEKVLQEAIKRETFEQRTQKRQVKKQDLDVEYQDLVKEFAKTQQYNVLVDPKQIEIMVKAVKNRVQKGVTNIEQAVDQIYQDMRKYMPELTKEDIYDAIGGLGRFQKMSEADIKAELKNIRVQRSDESLQKAYKTRLENRKAELKNMLETGNYEKTPKRKTKMNPELSKLKDEVDILKLKADREIQAIEQKNKPTGTKIYENAIDFVSLFKSTVSGGEFSQLLRQGMIYAMNPIHFKKVYGEGGAFREMFKYLKSESAYKDLQRQIENDPNAVLHKKMGIEFTSLKGEMLSKREEFFQSRLTKHIPWIRPFERSFTGFLDRLRLDVANDMITELKKGGQSYEKNPEVFKAMGSWINNATGRGTFRTPEMHRMFEQSSPALGLGLFSPRLIVSRMQLLNPYYYARLPKPVRIRAMKDMLGFVGTGVTALTLAKIAGADIELNPNSSDAYKVKIGGTRLDPWGGLQQFAVLASRMLSNETKTSSGKIRKLDGKSYPFTNRWDVARETLLENKLNPTFQIIKGFLTGAEWGSKEPYGIDDAFINSLVPLYYQDLIEATQQEGLKGLVLSSPGLFGIGVQTYKKKNSGLK